MTSEHQIKNKTKKKLTTFQNVTVRLFKSITDVAVRKHHQLLNEVLIFLPALHPENMPTKVDAILCNQHALVINACVGFTQHTPDTSFLVNFADFPNVWAKN